MDVLILAGGIGSRIKPILGNVPKSLAPLKDSVFIELLIDEIVEQGYKRIILCLGYKHEDIIDRIENLNKKVKIEYSIEDTPLGTGGAIKFAQNKIKTSDFLVLNGDSYCKTNLKSFVEFHKSNSGIVSVVISRINNAKDYGAIKLNNLNQIVLFQEKLENNSDYINAGIYCINKKCLNLMPTESQFSLECDVLNRLDSSKLYGYKSKGLLIDIGTPQRYKKEIEEGQLFTKNKKH